jgi:hypothetical protein
VGSICNADLHLPSSGMLKGQNPVSGHPALYRHIGLGLGILRYSVVVI